MRILTKKRTIIMLRGIEQIIREFDPLTNYAYTVRLTLYSKIKQIILKKRGIKIGR